MPQRADQAQGGAQPSPPKSRTTVRCGYKVGKRGGYLWWWRPGRSYVMRRDPATVRVKEDGPKGRWVPILEPPFELSVLLRELDHEALVAAGQRTIASLPHGERPKRTPHGILRRQAARQFFEEVPLDVQEGLKRGFQQGTFALFRLLMTSLHARELMLSEDGARLAWLLGNTHHLLPVKDPLRRARRWAAHKRRDALGALGFPATSAALSALMKVPRGDFAPWSASDLRRVLATPHLADRVRHLPRIPKHVIQLLTIGECVPHLSPTLLHELAMESPDPLSGSISVSIVETMNLLQHAGMPVPVFRSTAHTRTLHDRALDVLRARRVLQQSDDPFPPLPIALSAEERTFITPLGNSRALADEGLAMDHCLGRMPYHHELARRGKFYAFQIDKPERLTLAMHQRNGIWQIYDLKGPVNDPPTDPGSLRLAKSILDRFRVFNAPERDAVEVMLF